MGHSIMVIQGGGGLLRPTAAYARSDLFERRRLMDDWAEDLAGKGR